MHIHRPPAARGLRGLAARGPLPEGERYAGHHGALLLPLGL